MVDNFHSKVDKALSDICFNGTEDQEQKIREIAEMYYYTLEDLTIAMWLCSNLEYSEVDEVANRLYDED